jgi:hypothetical protein
MRPRDQISNYRFVVVVDARKIKGWLSAKEKKGIRMGNGGEGGRRKKLTRNPLTIDTDKR